MDNAQIASHLRSLAQLFAGKGENPYKVRAYRRAAETIEALSESVAELVHTGADLTQFNGIGKAIAGTLKEIVQEGKLTQLEKLRSSAGPELAELSEYPRLDPQRVLRVYKKLNISSVKSLKAAFERGEIAANFGARMQRHMSDAFNENTAVLLSEAVVTVEAVRSFLLHKCGANKAEPTGDYRRRTEVIEQLVFVVEADDFKHLVERFGSYGGKTERIHSDTRIARFKLASGLQITLESAEKKLWGLASIISTGSPAHLEKLNGANHALEKLAESRERLVSERAVYQSLELEYIEPELREGRDEVDRARNGTLPKLVTVKDICGDLHAHSTSSDGDYSIEQMAEAAKARGYRYLGISDHSQSLKIARGVSEEDLWKQIRAIDKLNDRVSGFQLLKSAEVDILADGALDYPDALLRELDYAVCSIHSKFNLAKDKQTARILRAMDNRYFNILGHATGRLLLRRPGYELDFERIIPHAKERGCYFEINANPNRLDLAPPQVRLAREAGVKIAICTDAHASSELDFITYGVDQARRAGLEPEDVLNAQPWPKLRRLLRRP